jgi:hypothetical protein
LAVQYTKTVLGEEKYPPTALGGLRSEEVGDIMVL